MKNLIGAICIFSLSSTIAFAGINLGQFENLNDKVGQGTNPYENTIFECSIELDRSENVLTIVQPAAYQSRMIFLGNSAVEQSNSSGVSILKTKKVDLTNSSGLCGDFLSAKSVQDTLKVAKNSVEITTSYRCGISSHKSTMTCQLK